MDIICSKLPHAIIFQGNTGLYASHLVQQLTDYSVFLSFACHRCILRRHIVSNGLILLLSFHFLIMQNVLPSGLSCSSFLGLNNALNQQQLCLIMCCRCTPEKAMKVKLILKDRVVLYDCWDPRRITL